MDQVVNTAKSKPKLKVKIKNTTIRYIIGDESLLDQIEPLWFGLNEQNISSSLSFKPYYHALTFGARKSALLQKAQAAVLRVELAVNEATNQAVGYCVSSLDNGGTGEVESIYVDKGFRGLDISDTLMRSALVWMDQKGAIVKQVSVSAGNEYVCRFYERYGFRARRTIMEQIQGQ
jgi:diamine N-acetyltransferase